MKVVVVDPYRLQFYDMSAMDPFIQRLENVKNGPQVIIRLSRLIKLDFAAISLWCREYY